MTSQKTLAAVLAMLMAAAPAVHGQGSSERSSANLSQALAGSATGALASIQTASGNFSASTSNATRDIYGSLRNLGIASSRGMSSAVRESLRIRNEVSAASGSTSIANASDQTSEMVGQFVVESVQWSGNTARVSGRLISTNSVARAMSEVSGEAYGLSKQAVTSTGRLISGLMDSTSRSISVNVLDSGRVVDEAGRYVGQALNSSGRAIRNASRETSNFFMSVTGELYRYSQAGSQLVGHVYESTGSRQVVNWTSDRVSSAALRIADSVRGSARWTSATVEISAVRSSASGRAISGAVGDTWDMLMTSGYLLFREGFLDASGHVSAQSPVIAVQLSRQTVEALTESPAEIQRRAGRTGGSNRNRNQ